MEGYLMATLNYMWNMFFGGLWTVIIICFVHTFFDYFIAYTYTSF